MGNSEWPESIILGNNRLKPMLSVGYFAIRAWHTPLYSLDVGYSVRSSTR